MWVAFDCGLVFLGGQEIDWVEGRGWVVWSLGWSLFLIFFVGALFRGLVVERDVALLFVKLADASKVLGFFCCMSSR